MRTVIITAEAGGITQSATLEVEPGSALQLVSLAVTPSGIQGGRNLSATATLSGPATAGVVAIQLASDNNAVKPPATLTIPFNQTSGTVTIPTSVVNNTETANITATFGRNTQTSTVTMNPPFILALSDSSVTGGASVTGSITLGGPAPAGRLTVSLQSTGVSVQAPPVVNIAANQSSASFTLNTTLATARRAVTISAP